jgi:hypothetical protein
MSTKKKVVVKGKTTDTKAAPTTSRFKKDEGRSGGSEYQPFFTRENYLFTFVAIGLIGIGFLLMLGGGMPSPDVWDEGLIYSFRRITLAPIMIIAGLVVGVYAIFK